MQTRTGIHRSVIAALLIAVASAVWAPQATAEKELVDEVVAVVEDEAIFRTDVEQAVKQFLIQRGVANLSAEETASLRTEALDELINNKLVVAKANRLGITVSFAEVQAAVDRAIEENKRQLGGEAAFNRQLAAEGLTLEGLKKLYREQIENRMLVERVLAAEIDRSTLNITDEDLRAAYAARKDEFPDRPAVVHLATIYLGMESSETAQEAAFGQIKDIQRRIENGEDFGDLAKALSEDPSAETGGNLGKLKLEDLGNEEFAKAADALSIGEVSDPVLTPFGYHLIQLVGRDRQTGEVELRHILIRIKPADNDIESVYQKATDIHQQLTDGAPFDSMAVRYSTDTETASKGGDLGWLRVAELPDFFQEVLRDLQPGQMSQVLREPTGFRIVKLIDREDSRPYEYTEVSDDLRKIVEQEKLAATYDDYLAGLRDEFYVEVRTQ
ncbi:MAG: peptidylprolyl isomerase [Candidatus Latescibacterota bacterium]|nr:MAG: peptidylprolyl isomerase [Candidatus Latescibacterota bacterium]